MTVWIRTALLLAPIRLVSLWAQQPTAATLPADGLLSEAGPTFKIANNQLPDPLTLIAYGDQRFTNPANTRQTNPRIRQWLVNQISHERPAVVIMNGDVPLGSNLTDDYAVFETETKPWRDLHLHVFPALGNHEFHGDPQGGPGKLVERIPSNAQPALVFSAAGFALLPPGIGQRHVAAAG